jgi:hypothetical protein
MAQPHVVDPALLTVGLIPSKHTPLDVLLIGVVIPKRLSLDCGFMLSIVSTHPQTTDLTISLIQLSVDRFAAHLTVGLMPVWLLRLPMVLRERLDFAAARTCFGVKLQAELVYNWHVNLQNRLAVPRALVALLGFSILYINSAFISITNLPHELLNYRVELCSKVNLNECGGTDQTESGSEFS